MISAAQIGDLISKPELSAGYSFQDLAEIRAKYPYCSTLHLLCLKNLALKNDLQFEQELQYSAGHVMDRERMYFLIHSGSEVEIPLVQEPDEPVTPVVEKPVELIEEPESVPVVTMETESTPEIAPVILEASPDIAEIVYTEDLHQKFDSEKITSEPESETVTSEIPPLVENTPDAKVDLSKLSFIEWLQYKQSGKVIHDSPKTDEGGDKIDSTENQTTAEVQKASPVRKSGMSKTDVDALLNKFIAEQPSISKPQAAFFNPVKNAKQSIEESPDLVTETLAKIYALQKNYVKAIQAYEQLSLLYPEKKTFFASRIEKIREEQNKI